MCTHTDTHVPIQKQRGRESVNSLTRGRLHHGLHLQGKQLCQQVDGLPLELMQGILTSGHQSSRGRGGGRVLAPAGGCQQYWWGWGWRGWLLLQGDLHWDHLCKHHCRSSKADHQILDFRWGGHCRVTDEFLPGELKDIPDAFWDGNA